MASMEIKFIVKILIVKIWHKTGKFLKFHSDLTILSSNLFCAAIKACKISTTSSLEIFGFKTRFFMDDCEEVISILIGEGSACLLLRCLRYFDANRAIKSGI